MHAGGAHKQPVAAAENVYSKRVVAVSFTLDKERRTIVTLADSSGVCGNLVVPFGVPANIDFGGSYVLQLTPEHAG